MVAVAVAVAHSPELGVKVYVVVTVLLGAGDQVPVTPSRLVDGNIMGSPTQIKGIATNVGVMELFIVRLTASDVIHPGAVSNCI